MTRPIRATLFGASLVALAAASQPGTAVQSNGWRLVHDRPLSGKYEDFAFPTEKDGWLASAHGDIVHTSDGGVTWTDQATGLGRLRSIDFLDTKRGFAGTINGVLYRTVDGGASWSDITLSLPRRTQGFCGITHVGDRVHIVGKYTGGAADYFYSPDGGKTWTVQDLKPLAYGLVDVMFLDASIGFIGGQANPTGTVKPGSGPALLLKTTDGGKTWRPVFTHDGGRGFVWKLFPITSKLIYAAMQSQDGTYRVAKTIDGGEHWDVLIAATGRPAVPAVQGVGFIDEHTGWIGGFFAGMYATTDGGKTWTAVPTEDVMINRFEKVGRSLFTAGTRGILRYDAK
jgi:photosystem II stability/assembly factor-like uncharacterized protein